MQQVSPINRPRRFQPSLEGVRGFGILLVFAGHYCEVFKPVFRNTWWLYPMFLLRETAWTVLPAFFVLSGYLICGILIDTREREGYFKVFYSRRILRVFPVYYITLIGIMLVNKLQGVPMSPQFWAHFFYIHNLFPGYRSGGHWKPAAQVMHLWSMAVEEQFYLIWPLVVWLCPRRRVLLRITWALIAACFVLRFAAPLLHVTPLLVTFWTPTRVDAVLLGAVLAIIRRDSIYARIEPYAKYALAAGVATLAVIAATTGGAEPSGYWRNAFLIPAGNFISAALIMAILEKDSFLNRLCSRKWACWLGARSYSFYLFHFTYCVWFITVAAPWLARYVPYYAAALLCIAAAFCLSLLLACVSYLLVEQPVMNLKRKVQYGASTKPISSQLKPPARAQTVLIETPRVSQGF